MKIFRAYKTELDPNRFQVEKFLQHTGCSRWAFNWGLNKKIEEFKSTGKSPSVFDLNREMNVLKKEKPENGGISWMYESSKCAPQEALRDLEKAFINFFRRCKSGAKKKGFPRFKSRKRGIGSFRLTGSIKVFGKAIKLPRIGKVKLKERGYLPTKDVKILSATISESVGRWFISLQVEEEIPDRKPSRGHIVGIDLGLKTLAVTSDGETFENPKALSRRQRLLRIRQKALSRKTRGSSNRSKAKLQVAKLHRKIANVRKDSIHKMTSSITKSASKIVIEDLNVLGMIKNHRLAKSISDASFHEIRRQLQYKSAWNGVELIVANRFFPSSKKCSKCGNVKQSLSLSEREYTCEICGFQIDRDLNAAINLKNLTGSSPELACRPESSGPGHTGRDETFGWAGTLPVRTG